MNLKHTGFVPRTYRLPLGKLRAAKRALGATTATETIERALDLVIFQPELIDGTRSMQGIQITSPGSGSVTSTSGDADQTTLRRGISLHP